MKKDFDDTRLLNTKETARYLGIGRTKVYAMFNEPDFPFMYVGRKKVVMWKDLYAWLMKHTKGKTVVGGKDSNDDFG
ncbi:MAG: helix-turn-helix domain-containing protein [Butyrivibrio sp.]|nr:helix-turn-helix domain-containing protein [Butyrivibrio sp.]